MFNWFKRKPVVEETIEESKEEKKPEYVDVGIGYMFLYTGKKNEHDQEEMFESFPYKGSLYTDIGGEEHIIHARMVVEAQFQQQADMGFIKLKDGSYISVDYVKRVQFATDSLVLEKGVQDEA